MAYPSTLTTFTNPLPNQYLNAPSHSSIETAQNTGLSEIQVFVGTVISSAVGTLVYDIRSPLSDGGGHIQTANKGGTGQTTYTKGDLLVAQSSSVLAKQAVGADDTTLTADSTQATGVKWATQANLLSSTEFYTTGRPYTVGISSVKTGSATIVDSPSGVVLQTTPAASTLAYFSLIPFELSGTDLSNYNKAMYWRMLVANNNRGASTTAMYYAMSDDPNPSVAANYAGIRMEGSLILAVSKSSVAGEQTTNVTNAWGTIGNTKVVDAVLTPSSTVSIKLNGSVVATHATGVPIGSALGNQVRWAFRGATNAGADASGLTVGELIVRRQF